jgi:hypothetical protein
MLSTFNVVDPKIALLMLETGYAMCLFISEYDVNFGDDYTAMNLRGLSHIKR